MEGFPRYTVCLRLRIEWEWIRNIRLNYRIRGRKAGAKDWSWTMQNDNCVAIFPKPFVYDVVRNTNPGMAVVDSPERYPDSHFLPEGEPWEIEVCFFKSGVFVHKQKILVSVKKSDNEESVTFIAMKM